MNHCKLMAGMRPGNGRNNVRGFLYYQGEEDELRCEDYGEMMNRFTIDGSAPGEGDYRVDYGSQRG